MTRTRQRTAVRRALPLVLVWLATAGTVRAAEPDPPAGPRLVCAEPEYDFGESDGPATIEHTFIFRNDGDADLTIRRVAPACGCTVVELKQKVVPPGGKTELETRLSLGARKGKQRKSILVESNDPENPQFRVWLKGTVIPDVALEPTSVTLGSLLPDAPTEREVMLIGRQPGVSITKAESSSPAIAVDLKKDPEGRCERIAVRTVPPLKRGPLHVTVTVHTDYRKRRELKLHVSGLVLSEVTVLPRMLVFKSAPETPVKRTILVRPGTVKDYKILKVEAPTEEATVTIKKQFAGTYRIQIDNLSVSHALNGKAIRIFTNVEQKMEILVPIRVHQ